MQIVQSFAFAEAETRLQERMISLAHQPQTFFGVPAEHCSSSDWSQAVAMLRTIRAQSCLPSARVDCLIRVFKLIPAIHRHEHPSADKPLGADDLLPVFIFVAVRARLPLALALHAELHALCDANRKMSEAGYYLACLEAALEHISISISISTADGERDVAHS